MVRRIIVGVILIGLGLALFGSQVSAHSGRMVVGTALLLVWGGTGLAVLAGRSWGRLVGLALSGVGVVVAIWEAGQANTGADGARFLVDIFFVARDPHFAWINVAAASFAFATLPPSPVRCLSCPLRAGPTTRRARQAATRQRFRADRSVSGVEVSCGIRG
jgi:hypothetical protein